MVSSPGFPHFYTIVLETRKVVFKFNPSAFTNFDALSFN